MGRQSWSWIFLSALPFFLVFPGGIVRAQQPAPPRAATRPAAKRPIAAAKRRDPAPKRPTPAAKGRASASKRPIAATRRPTPAPKRPTPAAKGRASASKRPIAAAKRRAPASRPQAPAARRQATSQPLPLARRIAAVQGYFLDQSKGFARDFAPSFLKAVPPARLQFIFRYYYKMGGPVVRVQVTQKRSATAAAFVFWTKKGMRFPVRLSLQKKPPHKIQGLWFGRPRLSKPQSAASRERHIRLLAQRLAAVRDYFKAHPQGFERHFAASFLRVAKPAKLTRIFRHYFKHGGKIIQIIPRSPQRGLRARYRFITAKQKEFAVIMGLSPKAPHKIQALWFGPLKTASRRVVATPARAVPPHRALKQRLTAVRDYIQDKPAHFKRDFQPSFLQAVPPKKLARIFRKYFRKAGKVVRIKKVKRRGAYYGRYRFYTAKGKVFSVRLSLSGKAPYKIQGLLFGHINDASGSIPRLVQQLKKLPGQVSFALWRLDPKGPTPLFAHQPNLPLAMGSTFKLYILGALLQRIEQKKARWGQTLGLKKEWRSWPSGVLHSWPLGAPVTLHTLALQMISISDNTATDHLLFYLGRQAVEKMLPLMGNHRRKGNIPFLGTREMFLLKALGHADKRIKAYLSRDEKGRRAYLQQKIARLPRNQFSGLDLSVPTQINRVEWFASAAALCRTMNWLRRHTAQPHTRLGRKLLAVNKGLSFNDKAWKYVGYKGGSEPGVLNLTWLAQKKDGTWLALSLGWNNTKKNLDKKKFFRLAQNLIYALEITPTAKLSPSPSTQAASSKKTAPPPTKATSRPASRPASR